MSGVCVTNGLSMEEHTYKTSQWEDGTNITHLHECNCPNHTGTEEIKEYRRNLRKEFGENITLHGYRQLVTEPGWRRVLWVIIMAGLISFAVYLFYYTLQDFGHKTVLEHIDEENGIDTNFPTITICGNSPAYSPESFNNFPLNLTIDEYKTFYLEEISTFNWRYNSSAKSGKIYEQLFARNITSYKDLINIFENTIYDSTAVWRKFLNNPTCYFGDKPCDLLLDFKETLQWKYSLCHQWNFYHKDNDSKRQRSSEETLTMLLDIHRDHKLASYYPFYGIVLYIHPYGTPHYLASYTDTIGLQAGMFTTIELSQTQVNLLPHPYSTGCGSKELKIVRNFPYTKALCEVDCILAKIYDECLCVGFEFEGHSGDVPICEIHQMRCYYKYLDKFKDTCKSHAAACPRECTYYKYEYQSSLLMELGDEIMLEGFNRIPDWKKNRDQSLRYIRDNLLGFQIGYKSLSQLQENYKPSVTLSAVVGTVGGSIGLCLGFSFVTGYEMVLFLYDYITAPWKIQAGRKSTTF